MKRVIIFALIFSLLCGCGTLGADSYVVVEPHNENYEVELETSALTVTNNLSLKNALLSLIEEGEEEGVIRADSYSGDIADDLSKVVYEVSREDPLGSFAVDFMTYDYTKIVSYYEIHIHTTYRRSVEDMASLVYVNDTDGIESRMRTAMATYEPLLRLKVDSYQDMDFDQMVSRIYRNNPQFALEIPNITVTTYPETGTQRILEITFRYENDQETLLSYQQEMQSKLAQIALLYGSANDDALTVSRIYNRLTKDALMVNQQEQIGLFVNSVYGALVENTATSFGYAQAYTLLLQERGIPCEIIEGSFLGQPHTWCRIILDDSTYYVDPTNGMVPPHQGFELIEPADLSFYGYELT